MGNPIKDADFTGAPCTLGSISENIFLNDLIEYDSEIDCVELMTPEQDRENSSMRDELIEAAKNVCATCPFAIACLERALQTEVFGVAAGMTRPERDAERAARGVRIHPATYVTDERDHSTRPETLEKYDVNASAPRGHRLAAVADAADAANVSVRTVYRQERATILKNSTPGTVEHDLATMDSVIVDDKVLAYAVKPAELSRVDALRYEGPTSSPADTSALEKGKNVHLPAKFNIITAAIFDLLANGEVVTKAQIIEAVAPHMPDDLAIATWTANTTVAHASDPSIRVIPQAGAALTKADRISRGANKYITTAIWKTVKAGTVTSIGTEHYQITQKGLESWISFRSNQAVLADIH